MALEIEPYCDSAAAEWDALVEDGAVGGTIFHTRRFLAYHPAGRFVDASIVVRDGGRAIALVPACVDGDGWFSHTGATYGGPLVHRDHWRVSRLTRVIDVIDAHYGGRLGMRLSETVFADRPLDPLLYLLGRRQRIVRELGVARPLAAGDLLAGFDRASTRSAVRQLERAGFVVDAAGDDDAYRDFHALLTVNLQRHGATPTHTADELCDLRRRLGDRQVLLLGRDPGGPIAAATWLIAAGKRAWHTFYIARDYDHAPLAAVPCVLLRAMELARDAGADWLNFGICTENRGAVMNLGLFDFKESLGGVAVNRFVVEPA